MDPASGAPAPDRCPSCSARLGPAADWCSLCLAPVRRPADAAPGDAPPVGTVAVDASPTGDGGWACPACRATGTPLEEDDCRTCGTPFAAGLAAERAAPTVDPRRARAIALALAGGVSALVLTAAIVTSGGQPDPLPLPATPAGQAVRGGPPAGGGIPEGPAGPDPALRSGVGGQPVRPASP